MYCIDGSSIEYKIISLCLSTGDGVDYLSVTLKEGVVSVSINLGSGQFNAEVKPPQEDVRFDDNSWHTLLVSRRSREVKNTK